MTVWWHSEASEKIFKSFFNSLCSSSGTSVQQRLWGGEVGAGFLCRLEVLLISETSRDHCRAQDVLFLNLLSDMSVRAFHFVSTVGFFQLSACELGAVAYKTCSPTLRVLFGQELLV